MARIRAAVTPGGTGPHPSSGQPRGSRQVFAPPKGGRARDVPLPGSMSLRLAAYLQAFAGREVTLPWQPTGQPATARLVLSTRESSAANRNYVNTFVWKPALRSAGVPAIRENGMHALRHHFASVLLEDGVSIKAVSEYLGHADPGFTLRTYTHLMPAREDRMRKAVDRALGESAADDPHGEVRPMCAEPMRRRRLRRSEAYRPRCRSTARTLTRAFAGVGNRRCSSLTSANSQSDRWLALAVCGRAEESLRNDQRSSASAR